MSASRNALVSVVIPCRNEAKAIKATVLALLNSEHPNVEVLVVDGMSDDGTRAIVEELCASDARVRLVDNPRRLTPFAFNLGVQNAKGDYIQIVGSRNVLAPDYIPLLLQALESDPKIACVGGDYQHVFDSREGRLISLAMESKFGMGASNYRTQGVDADVDTVGVPLYRRSIFREVGLFDETLTRNQDDEYNFRLRQKGFRIRYVHAAKTTYLVRGQIKKAFQQFRQYGYFKIFVSKRHGQLTTLRQLVPALFFGVFAVGVPLSFVWPMLTAVLSLLAAFYLAVGLTFAGRGLGPIDRFLVFRTCFVLHAAYAYGYWQGIWDFVICGRTPRIALQQQTT